jgi:cytochrome c556
LSATRTKVNNFNVDTADEADASKFQDDMNKFGDDVNAALDGADTVQKDPGLKAAFDKDATCKELNSQFPDSSS